METGVPRHCSAQNPQICTILISTFAYFYSIRLFLFPLANIVYSRTNGSYLQLFRFLLRFLPKTNSFTHVINTEVRNAEFNFNAKAFRRSLKNERIDCYFESFFVQDIPDEVFDLYCWIHSTYTIPRALRSLYILVISSATGTEGKTYRQVTTSFFQHPPNIDKDNPKCYAMNIVRTSFPS